jgi:hypothetical protein
VKDHEKEEISLALREATIFQSSTAATALVTLYKKCSVSFGRSWDIFFNDKELTCLVK